MGMRGPFCRSGGSASSYMPAPNPSPTRWSLLAVDQFEHGYVLTVRYHDCTNFEGVKVMVYRGKWVGGKRTLDPHFTEGDDSPIARFKPDNDGIAWARALADTLVPA